MTAPWKLATFEEDGSYGWTLTRNGPPHEHHHQCGYASRYEASDWLYRFLGDHKIGVYPRQPTGKYEDVIEGWAERWGGRDVWDD